MADFCRQCSIREFGEDTGDLRGLTTREAWAEGKAAVVLCEGCGPCQVDPEGNCISDDCHEKHGATAPTTASDPHP